MSEFHHLEAEQTRFRWRAVAMAGLGGTDLAKSLGNATGGLPFTVVVDAKGAIAHRKLGKVSPDDLKQWAQQG